MKKIILLCLMFFQMFTLLGCDFKKLYKATFLNDDNSVLYEIVLFENDEVVYQGETPVSSKNGEKEYTFIGWDKILGKITSDTTYIAQYKEVIKYKVDFINYDGTVLKTLYIKEGGSVIYTGSIPTREDEYIGNSVTRYKFLKWDKSLDNITKDTIIKAVYISETIQQESTHSSYSEFVERVKNKVSTQGKYDSAGSKYYTLFSDSNSKSEISLSYGIDNKGTYIGLDFSLINAFSSCVLRLYLPDNDTVVYKYNFVYVELGNDLYKGIGDGYINVNNYSTSTTLSFYDYTGNAKESTTVELCNTSFQLLLTLFAKVSGESLSILGFHI